MITTLAPVKFMSQTSSLGGNQTKKDTEIEVEVSHKACSVSRFGSSVQPAIHQSFTDYKFFWNMEKLEER